jgi:two-component system sensor histidine kinase YesM
MGLIVNRRSNQKKCFDYEAEINGDKMSFKNFINNTSLMKKLMAYFLLIILMLFLLNAFTFFQFKTFYLNFNNMLIYSVNIQTVSSDVDDLYQQVESYLYSGSSKYYTAYNQELQKLHETVALLQSNYDQDTFYRLSDIKNMISTLDEQSRLTMKNYKNGEKQIYINQSINQINQTKEYIQEAVKNLLLIRLNSNQNYYYSYWPNLIRMENIMYLLTTLVTLLCLFFAYKFSRQISIPIHQLVLKLAIVADGEQDVEKSDIKTNGEIKILVNSFNHMISQIKILIERISEKANVENKLKEEKIKNLEITNLLNRAELNFLQSQINPHFLFNTLNSIVVLADIEDASQTKKMIESMANILRYNLRKANDKVTIKEELEIIRNYMYIQKTRHGKRLEYISDIDESIIDCIIPSMILQPFVENSIRHGLEPKEGDGLLELSIYGKNDFIEIIIKDNGIGMSSKKLEELKVNIDSQNLKRGIGIANVMRRIEICYGKDVISFESQLGKGTTVKMRLPKTCEL